MPITVVFQIAIESSTALREFEELGLVLQDLGRKIADLFRPYVVRHDGMMVIHWNCRCCRYCNQKHWWTSRAG